MPRPLINRRDFLKQAGAAGAGAFAADSLLLAANSPEAKIAPRADTVIVLWMAGGMAHTETFDPKRYTPFEKGLPAERVLSTFPAIDTAVDHIKFTQGLENLASVMDRGALIRSYTAGDLGFILHPRHQYQWHTGYAPPQSVAAPHIGAVIARTLGPLNPAVPAFIDIGQRMDTPESGDLLTFHTAGFLGSDYGPFSIPRADQALRAVRPPRGMTPARFARRYEAYQSALAKSPARLAGPDAQKEALIQSLDKAHRLLSSPAAKAFDLSLEPEKSYQAYNTGSFGLGCLLARRLCEAGARFIEVTTEWVPLANWDTHQHGHTRTLALKQQIDRPVAQLVLDLEARGLLDRTLIVLASEFSRDMLVEGRPGRAVQDQVNVPATIEDLEFYGMHRHFTGAGCVLLFGGGIQRGLLYGETADERPCTSIKDPVVIEDLHATIYQALGISPRLSYEVERRPFYVTRDGRGKPIMDLLGH